jgi:hypothetical protein
MARAFIAENGEVEGRGVGESRGSAVALIAVEVRHQRWRSGR